MKHHSKTSFGQKSGSQTDQHTEGKVEKEVNIEFFVHFLVFFFISVLRTNSLSFFFSGGMGGLVNCSHQVFRIDAFRNWESKETDPRAHITVESTRH